MNITPGDRGDLMILVDPFPLGYSMILILYHLNAPELNDSPVS